MLKEEILKLKLAKDLRAMNKWYSANSPLHEMFFTSLLNKELAFLKPKHYRGEGINGFRDYKIFSPAGIRYYLEQTIRYQEKERVLNTYYSLATYDDLPDFGHIFQFRKAQADKINWGENYYKHITGYDCLIDIDSPTHKEMIHAKNTAKDVMSCLDEYNIPYYLRFSGKGYHIVIPYYVFKHLGRHFNPFLEDGLSIYTLLNDFTKALNEKYSELIDTDLQDSRRITKLPYSLVFYSNRTFVCWPFKTKEEFNKHIHNDYELEYNNYFGKWQEIYRRGQTLFNEEKFSPEKVTELLKSLDIKIKKGD